MTRICAGFPDQEFFYTLNISKEPLHTPRLQLHVEDPRVLPLRLLLCRSVFPDFFCVFLDCQLRLLLGLSLFLAPLLSDAFTCLLSALAVPMLPVK